MWWILWCSVIGCRRTGRWRELVQDGKASLRVELNSTEIPKLDVQLAKKSHSVRQASYATWLTDHSIGSTMTTIRDIIPDIIRIFYPDHDTSWSELERDEF